MDWKIDAKNEYLQGGTSYRKLAVKYGVTKAQVEKLAKREGWFELRRQVKANTDAKTVQKISKEQAKRAVRIQSVADKLLLKIDKIVDRIPVDTEDGAKVIRQVAATLKDIRDIQMIRSEADVREQEARIANLERQAQKADAGNEPIQVILSSDLEEYAQ